MEEFRLKSQRLSVGSIQHRPVAVGNALFVGFLNHIGTKGCFVLRIVQKGEGGQGSCRACGLEAFVKAVGVVANGIVGSSENLWSGTIIFFQLDNVRIFKLLGKIQNILNFCPTEAVN